MLLLYCIFVVILLLFSGVTGQWIRLGSFGLVNSRMDTNDHKHCMQSDAPCFGMQIYHKTYKFTFVAELQKTQMLMQWICHLKILPSSSSFVQVKMPHVSFKLDSWDGENEWRRRTDGQIPWLWLRILHLEYFMFMRYVPEEDESFCFENPSAMACCGQLQTTLILFFCFFYHLLKLLLILTGFQVLEFHFSRKRKLKIWYKWISYIYGYCISAKKEGKGRIGQNKVLLLQ